MTTSVKVVYETTPFQAKRFLIMTNFLEKPRPSDDSVNEIIGVQLFLCLKNNTLTGVVSYDPNHLNILKMFEWLKSLPEERPTAFRQTIVSKLTPAKLSIKI